ncbi:glycosyl transferase family 1 [Chroococcidiopsis sp. CCALA 051]|uniref:glycosyltransferase n=1 Tax=Chroococcidiopsis sp. CCALA 051 TaxID=869949 RepID=UPI000D0D4C65|nr:glycosyltransferase [Chroococcidiopsis sp. CCALA 051]PSM47915.1 glycosyl transferase family 1 [Chroococcidiopsis sp. CCALA 051]
MAHIGILCLAATGHLNTIFPLGRELQRRKHQVTIFSDPRAKAKALAAGFNFCSIGFTPDENGKIQKNTTLANLSNIYDTLQRFARIAETRLKTAPAIIAEQNVDALLVDLSVFEGGTIADYLNLPYVTICCMLPFYQDSAIPPIPTTGRYNPAWWAQLRNRAAYSLLNRFAQPVWQIIADYRQKWKLPAYSQINDIFSHLAIITRHIPEFEFPRQLPPHFHFTGPFHQAIERQPVEFPFEQLNGKPLIYASMGTLQNRFERVFHAIAAACVELDNQLVISLGGGLAPEAFPNLPGNPLVVKYAPQLELLEKASLNITHAGLNTTLESLDYGVPMVAIPITDDQPGVAARIAWVGAGEFVTLSRLNVSSLQNAIARVLTERSYKQNAVRLQKLIHKTGGVTHAADIIEQAVSTKSPVVC